MPNVYLLLGSNIGNRVTNIRQAILSLVDEGMEMLQISHFYETEAWGNEHQPFFLNICIKAKTTVSPNDLLEIIHRTEENIGRMNRGKWQEREIDIDILFYGNEVIQEEHLQIPHHLMIKRNFALQPLKEIAPQKKHPIFNIKVKKLAKLCTDERRVLKLKFKPKL